MTEIQNVEQSICEYIDTVYHLSLATTINDRPWVCEVHFAYDDELHLYFISADTRHTREIAQNAHVAGNIVEQHGLDDKPRGVYFEGVATIVDDVSETHPAFIKYAERLKRDISWLNNRKFYKITVSDWYMFDVRESTPPQKYHIQIRT